MRTQQSRPLNPVPNFDKIGDETVKKFCKDLAESLTKIHRNISDDISNAQNLDVVDSLPTIKDEYLGRLVILKGSGTAPDGVYLGIGTGGTGLAWKQVTLT